MLRFLFREETRRPDTMERWSCAANRKRLRNRQHRRRTPAHESILPAAGLWAALHAVLAAGSFAACGRRAPGCAAGGVFCAHPGSGAEAAESFELTAAV